MKPTKQKKSRRWLMIAAILVLLALALTLTLLFYRSVRVAPLITESDDVKFTVSSVSLGYGDDDDVTAQADLEMIEQLLLAAQGRGTLFPNGANTMEVPEDMLRIDGDDAKGPVHVVLSLESAEGFLYRNGLTRRIYIQDWEALYQSIRAQIRE